MEYRFLHYWQNQPGGEEQKILDAAVSLSLNERNEHFLQEAAAFIAEHAHVEYVIIGLLSDDKTHIHTCAFLKNKEVLENITYYLKGTPCDDVLIQRFCYYPYKVSDNFPDDKELSQMQIESYLGSMLLSESNEPLGIIALMNTKPIENVSFAEHLILVLSPAIEEELIKLKSQQQLP